MRLPSHTANCLPEKHMGENLWDAAVHSQGETPEMSLFASSLFIQNLQKDLNRSECAAELP